MDESLKDIQARHRQKYEERRKTEQDQKLAAQKKEEDERIKQQQIEADEALCRQLQEEFQAESASPQGAEGGGTDGTGGTTPGEESASTNTDGPPPPDDSVRAPMRTGYVERLVEDTPPWAAWGRPAGPPRRQGLSPNRDLEGDQQGRNENMRFLMLFLLGCLVALVSWAKPNSGFQYLLLCGVGVVLLIAT